MKMIFRITDITCDACIKLSSVALKKIPGVKSAEIDKNGSVAIESEKEISKDEIKNALAKVEKTALF